MSAVLVEEKVIPIGQGEALVFGTITMDASYATGGEAIDAPGDIGYHDLAISGNAAGYLATWDRTNQKLLAYQQSAATSALTQVPSTTDLSAVSFRFIGLRPA
jgi:hypothetical protein